MIAADMELADALPELGLGAHGIPARRHLANLGVEQGLARNAVHDAAKDLHAYYQQGDPSSVAKVEGAVAVYQQLPLSNVQRRALDVVLAAHRKRVKDAEEEQHRAAQRKRVAAELYQAVRKEVGSTTDAHEEHVFRLFDPERGDVEPWWKSDRTLPYGVLKPIFTRGDKVRAAVAAVLYKHGIIAADEGRPVAVSFAVWQLGGLCARTLSARVLGISAHGCTLGEASGHEAMGLVDDLDAILTDRAAGGGRAA